MHDLKTLSKFHRPHPKPLPQGEGFYRAIPIFLLLFIFLFSFSAHAEEGKTYNFNTKHAPTVDTPAVAPAASEVATPAPEEPAPANETAQTVKDDVAQEAQKAEQPTPAATPDPLPVIKEKKKKTTGYVYSPARAGARKDAEQLVRFFTGTCLKYFGRDKEMKAYMDEHFQHLDKEREAAFAPIVEGNIDTVYWDVSLPDAFYILAKNTANGKCDVIAKDAPSQETHAELKAVMDGLTLTKVMLTKTEHDVVPEQNKEVSIVNMLGHPTGKELGIVASTKLKDTGDNVAAILTLFAVPDEQVVVKEK